MEHSFNNEDLQQIASKGMTIDQVQDQLKTLTKGVAFMPLQEACTVGAGIIRLEPSRENELIQIYERAQSQGRATKFVPASGAATRMFKDLYKAAEDLARGKETADNKELDVFIDGLTRFAFYPILVEKLSAAGHNLQALLKAGDHATILQCLLHQDGLDYGQKPKALIPFHREKNRQITPVEEHMKEADATIKDKAATARLHFTVSPEHQAEIEALVEELAPNFPCRFEVTFSMQQEATDTIAVTPENQPFRGNDGSLVFRPGGHGALLENLNALQGDLIFIKNIDNVAPDRLKQQTIHYKKTLAGQLVAIQDQVFQYLRNLEAGAPVQSGEIIAFAADYLGMVIPESIRALGEPELKRHLFALLNRPIRVCGVVPNTGEPGGGPFWVKTKDGGRSLQIVETSQIDGDDPNQKAILAEATHFNPVDLVCAVKDYKGRPFDLKRFRDTDACFISHKSKNGRPLKALELPGLWNGAMAFWNTAFVEVPLITFNPVKTINDLLRPEHA